MSDEIIEVPKPYRTGYQALPFINGPWYGGGTAGTDKMEFVEF